jgi:hypothetical protein
LSGLSGARENLVPDLVDLAEQVFGIDWDTVRAAVTRRLSPTRPVVADVMDPRRYPSYWCVPVLVGDYVQADQESVAEDIERYVSGCLLRHFYHETPQPFSLPRDDELVRLIGRAYDACGNGDGTFDEHFAVKCQTWTVLLAFGTQAIRRRNSKAGEYRTALSAIVAVYSCTQLLDDWHDRADDLTREHWNLWTDEPVDSVLSVIEPLLRDAAHRVAQLRRHLLRDVLTTQLRDTTEELGDLVALIQRPSASQPRSGVESGVRFLTEHLSADAPGLWRDFSLPEVSAGSTECISAFIATLLARIPVGRSISRAVASTLLSHDRPSGGWGYREDVAEDADSTAWVILAAAAAGVAAAPGLIRRSQKFLLAHHRQDGGFATYNPVEQRKLTTGDIPGWSLSETTVTCSALLALNATGYDDPRITRAACDFVARRCTESGWPSYWWRGTAYGTWLAVCALAEVGDGRYPGELEAARVHILATRNSDSGWGDDGVSNAFDTALAIRSLERLAQPNDAWLIHESAAALAEMQDRAGRWPGGAQMLAPGVDGGRDLVLADQLITTACAVSALHVAAEADQRTPA